MYKIDRSGGGAQKSFSRTDPIIPFNLPVVNGLSGGSHISSKCLKTSKKYYFTKTINYLNILHARRILSIDKYVSFGDKLTDYSILVFTTNQVTADSVGNSSSSLLDCID